MQLRGSCRGFLLRQTMLEIRLKRRKWREICSVPYDLATPVITAWDLGIHDDTCIWFYQVCGRELHVIDYYQNTGKGLEHYAGELRSRKYIYKAHVLPRHVKARRLETGQEAVARYCLASS